MTFTATSVGDGAMVGSGGSRASTRRGQTSIPSVPGLDAFDHTTVDIWTNGGSFPPASGKRSAGSPVFITGTFLERSDSRSQVEVGYTHAILPDPTAEASD